MDGANDIMGENYQGDNDEANDSTIEYPYVSQFLRQNTFWKRIEEIRKFNVKIEQLALQPEIEHIGLFSSQNYINFSKNGKYTVLVEDIKASAKYTQIVDVFQEKLIVRAHYNGRLSLNQVYEENKNKIKSGVKPKHMIQFLHSLAKPISRFRPTLMISFIKMYRPHYILDFCSGWGDRLFSALMYNDKIKYYCGIDPNKNLFSGYNAMIQALITEKKDRKKYQMVCDCAESADIPKTPAKSGLYDMIITSPPYYDHEIYDDIDLKQKQSITKYKTLDDWYENFLLKSTKNALERLAIGGFLIISINDTGKHKYVTKYFDDITRMFCMKYIDLIYITNTIQYNSYMQDLKQSNEATLRGCQPIFVWQKTS
jgi:hypothetical protein